MEKLGQLKSKISDNDNLIIATPKRKSFILISILSIISIQSSFGFIAGFIIEQEKPPVIALLFMILVSSTIFFFAFREVL